MRAAAAATRRERSRLARCARSLGLGRNPLRRRSDRIEAAIRLALAIVLIAVVPLVAIYAGQWAGHAAARQARTQLAADRQVSAVLMHAAPPNAYPDPYASAQTSKVLAQWRPPGMAPKTGYVSAPVGSPKGSVVRIWVDPTGAATTPPATQRDVVTAVFAAVMLTCTALPATLVILAMTALHMLNRRRMRALDAEWRTIGPLWSGHRG